MLGASQRCLTWRGARGGLSRFLGLDGTTQRPQWGPWLRGGRGELQGDPSGLGGLLLEGPSSLSTPCLPAERCNAEEVCLMSWYTPMPIKNGSVVMRVDVSSNGLGPFIPNKRCPFPNPGRGVDSGKGFLIPRSPKKTGGAQREGTGQGGGSELWQEPESSPVRAPHPPQVSGEYQRLPGETARHHTPIHGGK